MNRIISKRPPGPMGNLITGSLNDLKNRVLDFFCELQVQYGDVSTIRFSFRNVSYIQHPDIIQHVLQENNRNYTKSLRYEQLKFLLGNGLLTSEGEFWLRQRRLVQPAFHKQKLQSLSDEMVECTRETLDRWESDYSDKELNIATEMMALTLQIVGKTLLNANVRKDAANVGESLSFLLRAVNRRARTPFLLPIWFPAPQHIKIRKSVRSINRVLDKIFDDRRNRSSDRYDLLSMLMEAVYEDTGEHMDNKQLRDEVMTIFMAGHETTANALSWTLYLLALHPEEMKKCMDEADRVLNGRDPSFESIHQMSYITMVLEESMRLYPPAWIIGRKTIHRDKLGDFEVGPSHNLLICTYAMHRDKRYWDNPEKFDPLRFTPEASKGRPKFAYLPFGGGPRLCIGNNFAMMEMQIVLAMILRRFVPQLVPGKLVVPEPLITLRPGTGVWMRLQKR